jgi:hypothetical protein
MIHIVPHLIGHIVHNSYVFIFILQHFKTVGEKKAVSHGVTNVLEIMLTLVKAQVFSMFT